MEETGAREKLSSGVGSFTGYDPVDDELLPWEGQKSDDGEEDKLSEYSSCGDSEFERYCSANSAMGTPSVSSSSVYEFADSEFGSLKSFKLGGENRNLKNFAVDNKLSSFNDPASSIYSRSECFDGKMRSDDEKFDGFLGMSRGEGLYENADDFLNNGEVGLVGNQDSWGNEGSEEDMNAGIDEGNLRSLEISRGSNESLEIGDGLEVVNGLKEEEFKSQRGVELGDDCLEGLDEGSRLEDYGGDVGRCSGEDEISSRHEHSEGEDSMFGVGSDDGTKADSYGMKNVQYLSREGPSKNENELFMTSTIAFGSDDWDDFMQETGGNTLNMMVKDQLHDEKQEIAGNEISYVDSASAIAIGPSGFGLIEQQEELVDNPRISYQVQDTGGLAKSVNASSSNSSNHMKFNEAEQGDGEDMVGEDNQINGSNELVEYPETCFVHDKDGMNQDSPTEELPLDIRLQMGNSEIEEGHQCTSKGQVTSSHDDLGVEPVDSEKTSLVSDPLSDNMVCKYYLTSRESTEDGNDKILKESETSSSSLLPDKDRNTFTDNSPGLFNHFEDHFSPVKVSCFLSCIEHKSEPSLGFSLFVLYFNRVL